MHSFLRTWAAALLPATGCLFLWFATELVVHMGDLLQASDDPEKKRDMLFSFGVIGSRLTLAAIGVAGAALIRAYVESRVSLLAALCVSIPVMIVSLVLIRQLEYIAMRQKFKRYWPRNTAGLLGFWIPVPWAWALLLLSARLLA